MSTQTAAAERVSTHGLAKCPLETEVSSINACHNADASRNHDPLDLKWPMTPARGIARAVLLSAPFWALVVLTIYLLN